MTDICKACGLALGLTGQRTAVTGGEEEMLACRNPGCGMCGKPQSLVLMKKSRQQHPPDQSEETRSARAAFVARKMLQKRH